MLAANKPTLVTPATLPVTPKNDLQVAADADYAAAVKILHQIIYDNARNTILNPNTHLKVLLISCLLFVAETMRMANEEKMGYEPPDLETYSFEDIPKVFSDRHYCMVLLSYYHTDREIREWWQKYYEPSNTDTRQAIFSQVQSYLDYLAEQHNSGQMTNELSTAYGMLQP